MFELIFILFTVVTLLLIWFNSEAFIEYALLFSGGKFFHIHDFKKKRIKDPTLDWISYLQLNHDSFFVRLITCQLCLSFWLNLVACLAMDKLVFLPISYVISLIVYKLTVKVLES
tara:strand:+ start:270 stop:614 length:345 start_codon:yes stop_codon:yes gene_type:complete